MLLQVLDDGRLTDGQGRTVNFKNTVIVLTSNIGSHQIAAIEDKAGLSEQDKKDLIERAMLDEVRKTFRPEMINRLDEIVVFHRLDRKELRSIVDIQLQQFAQRLAKRELRIELTDAAKDFLAERSAGIRSTARARSSAPSRRTSKTRSRGASSRVSSPPAHASSSTAAPKGSRSRPTRKTESC